MQLQILPGGDAQRAVAPCAGDVIVGEIRLGGHDPTRDSGADHHHVVLVEAELAGLLAQVAVVLLIDTVELEDHLGVVAEDAGVLEQLVAQGSAQAVAPRLDLLSARHLCDVCGATACIAHDQTVSVLADGGQRRGVPGIVAVS